VAALEWIEQLIHVNSMAVAWASNVRHIAAEENCRSGERKLEGIEGSEIEVSTGMGATL
jgi:hypothetical protein